MPQEILLKVSGIDKNFGTITALRGAGLTVRRGEVTGLIGENGSGKSTLTYIVAGMHKADAGEMEFREVPWAPASMIDALSKGIGMIVQEMGTIPGITVAENLFLGETEQFKNRFGLLNRKKMYRKAQEILGLFGDGRIAPDALTAELNLQDRKLIEVVRVVAKKPDILIVDEATTALSQTGRDILYRLMGEMKHDGRAVVFISHDLDEIMHVCDRLTVLRDGEIITHFQKGEYDLEAIKTSMIGRTLQGHYYREDYTPVVGETIALQADHISIPGKLKDISFTLRQGEILGIGGLSHCGMHELGKAVFGAEQGMLGSVTAGGCNIRTVEDAIRCGMGYLSKDRDTESLSLSASISDNIAIAGMDKFSRHKLLFPWNEKNYVAKQIDALRIKCTSSGQLVSTLSGGNKQKVVFGKWIGAGSDILIMDCPTRGIDIGVKQAMYQLIARLREQGKSFILISEELAELIGMADRILIMKDGAVAREFDRSKTLTEAQMIQYMI